MKFERHDSKFAFAIEATDASALCEVVPVLWARVR